LSLVEPRSVEPNIPQTIRQIVHILSVTIKRITRIYTAISNAQRVSQGFIEISGCAFCG
jgi:phage terminase large subunit-like protein